jgi:hypothetical protein
MNSPTSASRGVGTGPFLGLQRIKLMPAPRPVRWIGEGYASPLPAHRSFEIAAFKGITAQDPMATEKP